MFSSEVVSNEYQYIVTKTHAKPHLRSSGLNRLQIIELLHTFELCIKV